MKADIDRFEKVLTDYNQIVKDATLLIDRFNVLKVWDDYQAYRNTKFCAAQRLLKAYKTRGLYRYDILRIAGFVATEETFSNAIASLLDPDRPHQLGIMPLRNLLTTLRPRNEKTISAILKIIEDSETKIRVQRELHLGTTIPDIAITSNNFMILIENKLRGQKETETGDGTQTKRQWDALEGCGEKYGMQNLLGIFLTPEGKFAASEHFVPLSVHELVSAIKETLAEAESCDYKAMIYAFLEFYDWHDC